MSGCPSGVRGGVQLLDASRPASWLAAGTAANNRPAMATTHALTIMLRVLTRHLPASPSIHRNFKIPNRPLCYTRGAACGHLSSCCAPRGIGRRARRSKHFPWTVVVVESPGHQQFSAAPPACSLRSLRRERRRPSAYEQRSREESGHAASLDRRDGGGGRAHTP